MHRRTLSAASMPPALTKRKSSTLAEHPPPDAPPDAPLDAASAAPSQASVTSTQSLPMDEEVEMPAAAMESATVLPGAQPQAGLDQHRQQQHSEAPLVKRRSSRPVASATVTADMFVDPSAISLSTMLSNPQAVLATIVADDDENDDPAALRDERYFQLEELRRKGILSASSAMTSAKSEFVIESDEEHEGAHGSQDGKRRVRRAAREGSTGASNDDPDPDDDESDDEDSEGDERELQGASGKRRKASKNGRRKKPRQSFIPDTEPSAEEVFWTLQAIRQSSRSTLEKTQRAKMALMQLEREGQAPVEEAHGKPSGSTEKLQIRIEVLNGKVFKVALVVSEPVVEKLAAFCEAKSGTPRDKLVFVRQGRRVRLSDTLEKLGVLMDELIVCKLRGPGDYSDDDEDDDEDEHAHEPGRAADADSFVSFRVRFNALDKVKRFRMRKTDGFHKLFDSYAKKHGVDVGALKFVFDGERIAGETTPDELGLEDDDLIDAMSV